MSKAIPYQHSEAQHLVCLALFQVLLIGGSTGTMLEALEVVGDSHTIDSPLSTVGTITVSFETNHVVFIYQKEKKITWFLYCLYYL